MSLWMHKKFKVFTPEQSSLSAGCQLPELLKSITKLTFLMQNLFKLSLYRRTTTLLGMAAQIQRPFSTCREVYRQGLGW